MYIPKRRQLIALNVLLANDNLQAFKLTMISVSNQRLFIKSWLPMPVTSLIIKGPFWGHNNAEILIV